MNGTNYPVKYDTIAYGISISIASFDKNVKVETNIAIKV